jgi:5-methylcytosine-specific restriction endonuclease McrA
MHDITTYKSKSGSTVIKHTVYLDHPCSNSYASLVLLQDDLLKQDADYLANQYDRMELVRLSRAFLNNVLEEHGDLQCTYCRKSDLIIEEEGMKVQASRMATIDHVVPISEGADPFDTSNLVVACRICNGKKSNLTLSVFLHRYKGRLRPNYGILNKFLK